MNIAVDIKKTGFPVKVGEVELWVDTTIEGLRRLSDAKKEAEKELEKLKKKAKGIKIPALNEDEGVNEAYLKEVDAIMEISKGYLAAQYDSIFGAGTFEKLYSVYPDTTALDEALDPLASAIAEKINNDFKRISL